jgi:hypothetical protein
MLPGKIFTILILATVFASLGAWIVGWRYRAAMQRLMQAPVGAAPTAFSPTGVMVHKKPPAANISLADNQRAHWRLLVGFMALTLLIALSRTIITQSIADGPITIKTVATLGAAYAWPVLPVLAVIGRWSRLRFVASMLLWFVAAIALLTWRTTEAVSFLQVLQWMSFDIGLPLVVVTLLCLGSTSRAIAPWLAPIFVLLLWASQAGIDLLAAAVNADSAIARGIVGQLGAIGALLASFLLPWLLAWWPARALSRWLAGLYTRRQVSELFYLFTAVWVVTLAGPALGAIADLGWGALVIFAPLLWIPAGAALMQFLAHPAPGRPPTLLVLRVFRQDANVQALFDRVIERWRLSGNTVLIAGTDLADRTIDAEDIFTFIDGRLGERFIQHPGDLDARLAAFEWQTDVEGRHRVNECYCHDSTWQQALDRLVAASDVVLMDLRNFQDRNAGCKHELGVLAGAPGLQRVVLLTNAGTDLPSARAATANAPAGRFFWIDVPAGRQPKAETVLAGLLCAPPSEAHTP